jgi:hypothetical protein
MIRRKFIRNNCKSSKDMELHAVFGVVAPVVAYVNGTPVHAFLLLLACHMPLSGSSSCSSLLLSEFEEGY